MANKNNAENSNARTADTVICESLKVIKNDKETATSMFDSKETLRSSKETVQRYKICSLNKAEESNDLYQDIMSYVVIKTSKTTEVIKKNIDEYIAKDDEIEKRIQESSKLLNQMRIKIEEAHNAACAMSNCFKNKVLPKTGKSTKDGKKANTHTSLNEILDITKVLDEKGQNAFDSVVSIAGIQTFTNTQSLKDFMTKLNMSTDQFKSTVSDNIQSTTTETVKCREELNAIAEELAQITCDKKAEGIKKEALEKVRHFVCDEQHDDSLLDLCKETNNCYESEHSGYGDRKKRRHQHSVTSDQD
ncbi:hypothetical protein [Aquimarina algicola]|uniref:Uncharacterized protein n=1 Tax=Aquimarina algicola TaxID=2589995 RepID=A0A504J5V2_9FLAO|nr:hypothetical protein [Aquimarina algicola]TPN83955.1 hypothetical protein FHK87_18495 [Aquimarina algicola]